MELFKLRKVVTEILTSEDCQKTIKTVSGVGW